LDCSADSTDVVGYNVYNGDELEYATTSTETNYTVTGLTSSTDYTFTVKSKDKAGNLSDASNDETITTKPSAPTNLQASTTTSSSTVLTWTAQKMQLLQVTMFITVRSS
jgi:chitin-binding protein